ncbi:MAG: Methyltransferase type 12 [Deltaproteobacteria bacterium]|nr:Methyltransferase type 12 [Deltaproteobacteria bacterium]
MANDVNDYLMENADEEARLELKTDPENLEKQAIWCGIKPGMRVLDAGCGSGKTSRLLFDMVKPGGEVVGIDFSEKRIAYAQERYGTPGLSFQVCDLTRPLPAPHIGKFDVIWVRFVLEYFRQESPVIVKNLSEGLSPAGYLCLLDLDHNCLNHYDLAPEMEATLVKLMKATEKLNFDPYCGRRLYSYLYDLGFQDISMNLMAHHLIYGKLRDVDAFNWTKKLHVAGKKAGNVFGEYPGGFESFFSDAQTFFADPRRFTYTPLIMCKGRMKTKEP